MRIYNEQNDANGTIFSKQKVQNEEFEIIIKQNELQTVTNYLIVFSDKTMGCCFFILSIVFLGHHSFVS